jgi:dTDP-4-amino-4,6-dideoxygalactose transaminase
VAWKASQEILSLPCFPELTDAEVDAVTHAIGAFFEGDPECEC